MLPKVDDYHRARLAHGARERAEMQQKVERGEKPDGPRAAWLKESSKRIVALVAAQCHSFDLENPDSAASLADALDILWTARAALLSMGAKAKSQGGT